MIVIALKPREFTSEQSYYRMIYSLMVLHTQTQLLIVQYKPMRWLYITMVLMGMKIRLIDCSNGICGYCEKNKWRLSTLTIILDKADKPILLQAYQHSMMQKSSLGSGANTNHWICPKDLSYSDLY